MVCGCVWVGPAPARSEWHQHLRLCGWVGRLPANPWLDEGRTPRTLLLLLLAVLLVGTVGVGTAQAHPGHEEDDPGWNCVVDGNHVCGPDNGNGVTPGRYVDGTLVDPWPVTL